MKRTTCLLLLASGALFAQQNNPVFATTTFYDVTDEQERAYLDFSKTSTKKLAEAILKEDPAVRSIVLSVRLYGGNPAPAGRYRLAVIRDGYPTTSTELMAKVSMKATGMSYDDYIKKANSLRKRVGQTLRQRVVSTNTGPQVAIAEGDIIQTDLMKIMPDRGADYYNLERNDYLPLHAERVKSGALKSWSLWAVRSPAGAAREFDAVTTAVHKDLESALKGANFSAIYRKLHPEGNMAGIADRTRAVRKIQRVDLWQVAWAVTR